MGKHGGDQGGRPRGYIPSHGVLALAVGETTLLLWRTTPGDNDHIRNALKHARRKRPMWVLRVCADEHGLRVTRLPDGVVI